MNSEVKIHKLVVMPEILNRASMGRQAHHNIVTMGLSKDGFPLTDCGNDRQSYYEFLSKCGEDITRCGLRIKDLDSFYLGFS